jgi:hypothetical protein
MTVNKSINEKSTILAVDDTPDNLSLISNLDFGPKIDSVLITTFGLNWCFRAQALCFLNKLSGGIQPIMNGDDARYTLVAML